MSSINKVMILGRLGQDPELRYTQAGQAFCKISIATTEKWKGQDGQMQEKTEWHRITVWGKQGENAAKYLKKGSLAHVEGSLTTSSWTDDKGEKRYSTEIKAERVTFIDSKGGSQAKDSPVETQTDSVFGGHDSSSLDDIPF